MRNSRAAWDARPGIVSITSCGTYADAAVPDLPASTIEAAFLPLADRLACYLCRQNLVERAMQVVVQWSMVKVRYAALGRTDIADLPIHAEVHMIELKHREDIVFDLRP